ncbi:MAG: ABC transporter ATP-binding protein [Bacteroidetes bacterium HGW-Bacteroidetes-12]|nr:MAG: ABC transporter ATP-binding protein [Bacteroidetes bacterium HGW-Bacteroidetes-12]
MPEIAIHIENLSYRYQGQLTNTLSDINLKIEAGSTIGLFGPNGAGKTTLMHLMTGILKNTNGTISLFNSKVGAKHKETNNLFGFVPQDFSFYQELSPTENLQFFGAFYGLSKPMITQRTDELLEVFGLTEVRKKPVAKFSGGMKRKVNLAIGIIHQPKIIFLDEPTVGVDVQSRCAIMDYIKKLNEEGATLVYTSHQLNEAEEICEKIALINEGKIIAFENISTLLAKHQENNLENLFLNLSKNPISHV